MNVAELLRYGNQGSFEFVADQSRAPLPDAGGFPQKMEHVAVMHGLSKKAPPSLPGPACGGQEVSRLINCELDAGRYKKGAPSGGGKEEGGEGVTNNSRVLVYLRSFSTTMRSNTNFDLTLLFSTSLSCLPFPLLSLSLPLFFALFFEFYNVIYGAWRNSFRFLGLRATEFTTPDILTSSFFSPTPGPLPPPTRRASRSPLSPVRDSCLDTGVSWLILHGEEKRNNWSAHVCTRISARGGSKPPTSAIISNCIEAI